MKQLYQWIFIIFVLAVLIGFNNGKKEPKIAVNTEPTKIAGKSVVWWKASASNLRLIDNTKEMADSKKAATEAGCRAGISAFYYDKSNKPLGTVIIDHKLINKYHKSNLLNGYVYVINDQFAVGDYLPDEAIFAHQAGPVLISNFKLRTFNLDDRILDRRSVAGQTEDDRAVFVWVEEATLAQLPEILVKLSEDNGFKIKNAINLDGGNSSVIWTEEESRRETFFAGGFWCKDK